jgi:hypothetical protein
MKARSHMAFLIAGFAYAQPCTLPKLTGSRAVPGSQEGRFCAPATLPLRQGTAQVLFDDSGSMKGFQNHVSQLALWSEQSLSHVRQWGTSWTATRGCYFSSSRPLRSCTSRSLAANGFRGAADTTLQEAIESASAFDLTVIFTDGAAAAGSGSGDCAGGVDAACAARAMARALTPQPGQAQGVTGGIWLVPLAAMFDGPFFTEQPMDPGSLDTARVQANVAADTATNALLGSPSRTSKGLLVYSYRGPRLLLAMVLARNAEVGRAFVASLSARMSFAQVQRLTALKQFQNGLAALRPIEVYPGAIPPVEFTRASVLEPTCQTLDAKLSSSSMLSVSCANELDRGVVHLETRPSPESSDCVDLVMLPALPTAFSRSGPFKVISDSAWAGQIGGRPGSAAIQVSCSRRWTPGPSACEKAEWIYRRDYQASAADLAMGRSPRPAVALIRELTAAEVATRPHRLFQLNEMLEKFYRNAMTLPVAESSGRVAQLQICR